MSTYRNKYETEQSIEMKCENEEDTDENNVIHKIEIGETNMKLETDETNMKLESDENYRNWEDDNDIPHRVEAEENVIKGFFTLVTVNDILNKRLSMQDKLFVKVQGPPRPNLELTRVENQRTRSFNASMYKRAKWLCGCEIRNAFFCFTCILINSDSWILWTSYGVRDLINLTRMVIEHNGSSMHLNNEIELAFLGKSNMQFELNSDHRLALKQQNEQVKKNLFILNKIIDEIKFYAAFEFSQDYKITDFKIVDILSEIDNSLKDYLNINNTFINLSKNRIIQKDILDAIWYVCHEEVKNQVANADFVSIQADVMTDIANKQQMAIFYRYELNGEIFERFWDLFCPENYSTNELSSVILQECNKLNINKLISQSYDGPTIMIGKNSVQERVKKDYKDANFIHSYNHEINLIMEKAVCQNRKVKIFFSNLEGFSAYFARSAKRTDVFNHILKLLIPEFIGNNKILATIFVYQDNLLDIFDKQIDDERDYAIIRETIGLKNLLNDPDFKYWLDFFNKIMPHIENLNADLQEKNIHPLKVASSVEIFKRNISEIRDNIDASDGLDFETSKLKRRKIKLEDNNSIAKNVCDIVVTCAEDRFAFTAHIAVALLLCPEKYEDYRASFPERLLQITSDKYSSFINIQKLRQELTVIYYRNDFSTCTAVLPMLQTFLENNLIDAFSETVQLLKMICTIPMITEETERMFSTLKRLKIFLKSTVSQDRLSALAMCYIERDIIQNTPNFNARVIEHFLEQNGDRSDFMFKRIKTEFL